MSKLGTFSRVEWLEDYLSECIITITTRRRKWLFFGPVVEKVRRYRGSCTVWSSYPSGHRCWTPTEGWLSNIWERATWERDDAKRKQK